MLGDLPGRVLRMIGIGRVDLSKDDGEQQFVKVHIGKGGPPELEEFIDDVPRMGHYGLFYRPPDGSEVVVLYLGGRRSSGVVVATGLRETRVKNLEPGEVGLCNQVTGAFVKFCADGKIRSQGDWEHTGSFKATDDILDHSGANTATMKVHRDQYNAHKHGGVTAGGAMTAVTDHTAP